MSELQQPVRDEVCLLRDKMFSNGQKCLFSCPATGCSTLTFRKYKRSGEVAGVGLETEAQLLCFLEICQHRQMLNCV